MKFKQYIKESRTKKIKPEDAMTVIQKNCKKYLAYFKKGGHMIYRGVDEFYGDYGIIKPQNFEKRSRNTSNYYTLFIDNYKSWKNFPKRSKSIICSTAKEKSNMYSGGGGLYYIFPFDNAKIGICPSSDIWASFDNVLKGNFALDEFNQVVNFLLQIPNYIPKGKSVSGIDAYETIYDDTFNEYKKATKKFDDWFKLAVKEYIENIENKDEAQEGIKEFLEDLEYENRLVNNVIYKNFIRKYNGNFLDTVGYFLDPQKTGFKSVSPGKQLPYDKEVWIEGTCVLINTDIQPKENNILNEI